MGRRPLSSYSSEELEKMKMEKSIEQVDAFFDGFYSDSVEETEEFILKNEGTQPFFYLLAKLIHEVNELKISNRDLSDKVEELEKINEQLGGAFSKKRNEYGF